MSIDSDHWRKAAKGHFVELASAIGATYELDSEDDDDPTNAPLKVQLIQDGRTLVLVAERNEVAGYLGEAEAVRKAILRHGRPIDPSSTETPPSMYWRDVGELGEK